MLRGAKAHGLLICLAIVYLNPFAAADPPKSAPPKFDATTLEQAVEDQQVLDDGGEWKMTAAMGAFGKTVRRTTYQSGSRTLPGFLYKPEGDGPFPAIVWNYGSEKNPGTRPMLARFYVEQGFVFFAPIRRGHGKAPGEYIMDVQKELEKTAPDRAAIEQGTLRLLEEHNDDVAAAIAWIKTEPFVDSNRLVVSGCSYGGIQTLLAAEKGLGVKAFAAFAPAAMSFGNQALRRRLTEAVAAPKAPVMIFQAKNDFSTTPSEVLGPILEQAKQGRAKIYPPFGKTSIQGHAAFATWSLGAKTWGGDLLDFVHAAFESEAK
jgi:dienelactone hydrolase